VVVYLRALFYPDGFIFPLADLAWTRSILLTEVGREAATIVVIVTSCWLFGRNLRQRFAYFFVIFAVWDIFYYVWLKVLIDWPATLMDWDILFLIPMTWASPVLAPVLASLVMLGFAVAIIQRDLQNKPIRVSYTKGFGFIICAVTIIVSFCLGGRGITEPNFQDYFYWPLFAIPTIFAIVLFIRTLTDRR
jgi:hypothetical protein